MKIRNTKPADIFGDIPSYVAGVQRLAGSASAFVASSGLGCNYLFPLQKWERLKDGGLVRRSVSYKRASETGNPVCRLRFDVTLSVLGDVDSELSAVFDIDRMVFSRNATTREIAIELCAVTSLVVSALEVTYFSVHWHCVSYTVAVSQLRNKCISALASEIRAILARGETLDGECFVLRIAGIDGLEGRDDSSRFHVVID